MTIRKKCHFYKNVKLAKGKNKKRNETLQKVGEIYFYFKFFFFLLHLVMEDLTKLQQLQIKHDMKTMPQN